MLQNLTTDADVISWVLNLQMLSNYLDRQFQGVLPLYFGIADFFVLARKGNSCFGEAICTQHSGGSWKDGGNCWIAHQCFRSADNNLKISDKYIPGTVITLKPHLQGMIFSGTLWNLRRQVPLPARDFDKMVFHAVTKLIPDSGGRDFFLALLTRVRRPHKISC